MRAGEAFNTVEQALDPAEAGQDSIAVLDEIIGRLGEGHPMKRVIASIRHRLTLLAAVQPPIGPEGPIPRGGKREVSARLR
jgi:hypothetical protein